MPPLQPMITATTALLAALMAIAFGVAIYLSVHRHGR